MRGRAYTSTHHRAGTHAHIARALTHTHRRNQPPLPPPPPPGKKKKRSFTWRKFLIASCIGTAATRTARRKVAPTAKETIHMGETLWNMLTTDRWSCTGVVTRGRPGLWPLALFLWVDFVSVGDYCGWSTAKSRWEGHTSFSHATSAISIQSDIHRERATHRLRRILYTQTETNTGRVR